mgnify:CR=1 FL=1
MDWLHRLYQWVKNKEKNRPVRLYLWVVDPQSCAITVKSSGKISEFLTIRCLDFDSGYEFIDFIIFTQWIKILKIKK